MCTGGTAKFKIRERVEYGEQMDKYGTVIVNCGAERFKQEAGKAKYGCGELNIRVERVKYGQRGFCM